MLSLLFLTFTFQAVLSETCLDQATTAAVAAINTYTPNGIDITVDEVKQAIQAYVNAIQYGPPSTYNGCATDVPLANYETCLLLGWGNVDLTTAQEQYVETQVANFITNTLIPLLTLKFDATIALNFTETFWACVLDYDTAATSALTAAVNVAEAEVAVVFDAWGKFRSALAADLQLLKAALPQNGTGADTCVVWALSATKFGAAATQYALELDALVLLLIKETANDYQTGLTDLVAVLKYVEVNGLSGLAASGELATFKSDLQALFRDSIQWAALKQAGTAYSNWVKSRTNDLKNGYDRCKAGLVLRYESWVAFIKAKATSDVKAIFAQACPDVQADWSGLTWQVTETTGSNDPLQITIAITVPQANTASASDLQTCLNEALVTFLGASANHVTLSVTSKRALLDSQQGIQSVTFSGNPASLANSVVATFFFLVVALFLHF